MKIARIAAWGFGALGAFLMGIAVLLCLMNLNKQPVLRRLPQQAVAQSDAFAKALDDGDLAAAGQLILGQPELGIQEPKDAMSKLVWQAFLDSLSFEYTSNCYAGQTGICRNGTVTALDVPKTLESLKLCAHDLLSQRVITAESMEDIYDEQFNFREDVVQQVLNQALTEMVRNHQATVTKEVAVMLVQQDGQWYAVPDQALLQAISGSIG